MKILIENPPNIDDIDKVLHVKDKPGVLFTYGDSIYNPFNVDLPPWIISHEEVHCERQMVHGPEYWWDKYLKDIGFRYEEELLAHQREYQVYCAMARSRNERRLGLKVMAKRLSSDLYGSVISFKDAKEEIKNVQI